MKPIKPETELLPEHLPGLAILGLRDPREGDWLRLRSLQYASLAKGSKLRIAGHAVAALAAAFICFGAASIYAIIGWLALLGAVLFHGFKLDHRLGETDYRRVSRGDIYRHAGASVLLGLVWSVPISLFMYYGRMDLVFQMWAITATLVAIAAAIGSAAPLGTVVFSAVITACAAVQFLLAGQFAMVVIAAALVAYVAIGSIGHARTYLIARVAQAAMLEKGEVVSLLLREFEEGEADWLWQIDTARRVRSISPRFAFALGCDTDEIEGKPFIQLIAGEAWESGEFPPSLHDLAEQLERRESFSNVLVRVKIKGQARWWELSGTPKLDESGVFDGFRGVGSDVTEKRENADQIARLARYDTLTGLPNRLMLHETMGEAMRFAEQWRTKCAFMMIDLDRFKLVNDTLGHAVGDQLLAQVSARLREIMSENEFCGRLGGDEFAIIIRDASDLGRVERVAQAVIERLSQPYEIDHHTLYIGASIGSAIGPRDGSTVETLIRNADLALYRAKDAGGGTHFNYEPTLHAHAEERRKLESSLRQALENNEFSLHYQPVVDAESEQVVSFEALLRWQSADHGSVSPAQFIPLAEDTRLIRPIGEWVLREACREATNWPGHIKVAVNVSGEQLLDPQFSSTVVAALAASGLPASRLEIEVTENIFVRDAIAARATLEQIMALGAGIALDDFGTGYSSLGYLRKMHFSTIKIDRSFVKGAATGNRESLAIIRAVVAMAQSLDMTTTAEGVETEAELTIIRNLGVNKIQGHYYGRPMIATEAAKLFLQPAVRHGGEAA